ncbi:MAG: class II glutamine amidotransferase [Oceanospirillum sp.]|nr:class II glutamine amidotransferase [Oceanospirillum sp.]
MIATQPLTDNENWTTLQPGELVVFKEGRVVEQFFSKDVSEEV